MKNYDRRDIRKALKELGFHELVYTEYHSCYEGNYIWRHHQPKDFNSEEYSVLNTPWYSIPTLSLVQKWLREEKNIHICINIREATNWYYTLIDVPYKATEYINDVEYKTYEQALSAGIDKCIELLKETKE